MQTLLQESEEEPNKSGIRPIPHCSTVTFCYHYRENQTQVMFEIYKKKIQKWGLPASDSPDDVILESCKFAAIISAHPSIGV
jgi:hypothetical protein